MKMNRARRAPRPTRRRVWRVLGWTLAVLLALLIAAIATAVVALRTEAGTRQLWTLATRFSAGMLAGRSRAARSSTACGCARRPWPSWRAQVTTRPKSRRRTPPRHRH